MQFVSDLIQRRQQRRRARRSSPGAKAGLAGGILFSLVGLGLVFAAASLYSNLTRTLPPVETIPALLEPPSGLYLRPTRLYDRTGEHLLVELENPAVDERVYLQLPDQMEVQGESLSQGLDALAAATVAAADENFWDHSGYTLSGLQEGAHPTLAQRLVIELILWQEPVGLRRNLRERLLAGQLTSRYGRTSVLEWYLNYASYGEYIYGASQAARVYFDKSADELTLAEAALLAAVSQAPGLNPFTAPQAAIERQKLVLQSLAEQGVISDKMRREAEQEKLGFAAPVAGIPDPSPALTRLVLEQLAIPFGIGRVERGGLDIRTTLDYDLQLQAACAVQIQISRLEKTGPTQARVDCEASRLLPTVPVFTPALEGSLEAQLVVLDPNTGQALAFVETPRASSTHAPGTVLTPFIHLTAYTRGLSPASMAWDLPSSLPEPLQAASGEIDQFHGPVSLRAALANDYLAPTLQTLLQIGSGNVLQTAHQFGILSLTQPDLDQMLSEPPLFSQGEVTPLEIAQAYGVFATQGILAGQVSGEAANSAGLVPVQPVTVLSVTDPYGQVWMSCEQPVGCNPTQRLVSSQSLAYLVTHVLSDEPARWSSLGHPNPLEIGRPAGAKIGSPDPAGAWTAGFTPQLAAVVWLGSASETAGESSRPGQPPSENSDPMLVSGAAGLWHAVMQYASRDLPPNGWPVPAGVVSMEVCYPSGLLPTDDCPLVTPEVFLVGNEPAHADNLYQAFYINRETGRLATVFTPQELLEERVYLVVPPAAAEWAEAAGLPLPPQDYDVIYQPPATDPQVQIAGPAMFAQVGGKVSISGTAAGDDFESYRVQVGKGLNPTEWLLLGEDKTRPVSGRTLAVWDTTGLEGLYAIQLQVVRENQRVDTAVIQVTVDNTPPQVDLLQPAPDQVFTLPADRSIVFQAQVEDPALSHVEFSIDGRLLAVVYQAPFILAWEASPGAHTVLIKAYDLAGNYSQVTAEFTVTR